MNRHLQACTALVLVLTVHCFQYIPNLRQFRSEGYGGVFDFNRFPGVLEDEIRKRLETDPGFPLQLRERQVWMFISTVLDYTLVSEGVIDDTGVSYISFTLPVSVGNEDADLQLAHFTDNERFFNPYLVNYEDIKVVDRIDVNSYGGTGTIFMSKGPDEMLIEVRNFGYAKRGANAALLKRGTSTMTLKTDFPSPLDWGCNQMERKASFCHVLEAFGFGIKNTDPNVCNINENLNVEDDGQFYEITIHHMTGYFAEQLPFIAPESLPLSTEFAFYGDVTESVGFVYPCVY